MDAASRRAAIDSNRGRSNHHGSIARTAQVSKLDHLAQGGYGTSAASSIATPSTGHLSSSHLKHNDGNLQLLQRELLDPVEEGQPAAAEEVLCLGRVLHLSDTQRAPPQWSQDVTKVAPIEHGARPSHEQHHSKRHQGEQKDESRGATKPRLLSRRSHRLTIRNNPLRMDMKSEGPDGLFHLAWVPTIRKTASLRQS